MWGFLFQSYEMDLEKLSKDLKDLKIVSNIRQLSMFERLDVSRYENVSSKMLEFLFNSEEEHGIGNLAIVALLEEANILFEQQPKTLDCISEVHATSDKFDNIGFIDLVVKLQDYTLVIENKISHILNNPFDLYQEYAKATYTKKNGYSGNNKFIIMGIDAPKYKDLPTKYIFVSHEKFCQNLKIKLIDKFENKENNKSLYFINDYIEAIENMTNTKVNKEKEEFFNFITENYQKLDYLQEQQQYLFEMTKNKLEKIIDSSTNIKKVFSDFKILKNNTNQWAYKGFYVHSHGIKKVFNGSEITVVLNVLSKGVFFSIAMHDNRRKKESYSKENIIKSLKGYRLLPSEDKMEQLFDWEVIVAYWDYIDFSPQRISIN